MDNLNYNVAAGRHAFFGTQPAWHHLGKQVQQALNWSDAMTEGLINFTVSKHQLISPVDGRPIDLYGIFRDDTNDYLGHCSQGYGIIQSHYMGDFVDAILEASGQAHYEAAGALGKGEVIWCLAKINGVVGIQGTNDNHEVFLLFTTSHDSSIAATCKIVLIRVVCMNTLLRALRGAGAFMRIRHTANALVRLEEAKKLMTGAQIQVKDIEAKFNELAKRKVTKESFFVVMKKLFGDYEATDKNTARTTNKIAEIARLFDSNDNNAVPEIQGTAYSLLNSITEYTDHLSPFRRTASKAAMSDQVIRAENAMFGTGADLKEDAFDIILEATANDPRVGYSTTYAPEPTSRLLDQIIANMQ